MKTVAFFRLAAMTLLLIMVTQRAVAWPGSGTSGNPYQIASVSDWNTLATNVNNGTSTYSGKCFCLTADLSISTMVGNSEDHSFRGTFDGRGHTLTISYNTHEDLTAPFRYIQGATFKNLKVTGNITTTMNLAAGIAGLNTNAVATFEQCATDVTINSSSTTVVGWGRVDYHGGLLARSNNVNVNITDCFCGGSVNGSNSASGTSYCASFVGVAVGCTVSATRCLCTTSYTNVTMWNPLCHAADAVRSTSAFYYVNGNDACDGATQVTTSQVADGSLITALQAGRATTIWVQYNGQPTQNIFAFNKAADGYYLIGSEPEWRSFASLVQTIPTANARMTADISVTTMIGGSEGHEFSGTFDGDGHRLTVNIPGSDTEFVAPFHRVSGGNIRNLYVDGTVSSYRYHMSGLIGRATGTVSINNCVVAVDIRMSTDYAGGFVGNVGSRQYGGESFVTLTGCLFIGTFTEVGGTRNKAAGFCGWGLSTPAFINCLENGTFNITGDIQPYMYQGTEGYNPTSSSNSYYNHGSMSASWVKRARTITAGDDVTINNLGDGTEYDVSGITAYTHGIKYNGNYYAGNGDAVGLSLSHGTKTGYTFSQYTVTGGGSLANPTTNSPTLTMTDADQVIGAEWNANESLAIPVTSATIMDETKYVTTFYHGTLDYQLPTGALAYTAGIVDGKVVFYRIGDSSDIIPKKTAVIIVASSSGPITLTKLSSTDVTAKAGNILRGSDTDIAKPAGTVYVLSVVESTPGFYPFTGSTLPAGKAYYVK